MFIPQEALLFAVVILMWNLHPLLEAALLRFGSVTQTIRVRRSKPDCPRCGGDGAYLHPLGVVVDCTLGCNEPISQRTMHWRVRGHIEELGKRMGMGDKKAHAFAKEVEAAANEKLGPPIPCFVRTPHGWEYRNAGTATT